MTNWNEAKPLEAHIGPFGWGLVVVRAVVALVLLLLALSIHLPLRLMEYVCCGAGRPVTPVIAKTVTRCLLWVMGLRYGAEGQPMGKPGAVVANHASWLDILVLNAGQRVFFVSKAEVARWPFIGWLARAAGTVFISRKSTEARRQQDLFEERLLAGHKLLFFPEGTSTDAQRVLPFKSTLFQAFFSPRLEKALYIQPVTVIYHAPSGADPRFHGWWGDMDFGHHLLRILCVWRPGRVQVIYHPEVPVAAFASRKELALYCENVIRTSHPFAANESA